MAASLISVEGNGANLGDTTALMEVISPPPFFSFIPIIKIILSGNVFFFFFFFFFFLFFFFSYWELLVQILAKLQQTSSIPSLWYSPFPISPPPPLLSFPLTPLPSTSFAVLRRLRTSRVMPLMNFYKRLWIMQKLMRKELMLLILVII